MDIIRSVWQKYDKDGQGYMNRVETQHFVDKYFRDNHGINVIPQKIFNEWFRALDKNGNNLI
jgi:hypothetical protein